MQEIKSGRRLSLGRRELWTELTHHSKYRQERQTWGGEVQRLCRSMHGSRRVQESQSLAGFKTGKRVKAKKNVDPLLKEVGDLVTTILLTSAFSVCLGFPVEFCPPLSSASQPSSRVFRDKELAVVEEDQVTELLSQLDVWKSRGLDRMH